MQHEWAPSKGYSGNLLTTHPWNADTLNVLQVVSRARCHRFRLYDVCLVWMGKVVSTPLLRHDRSIPRLPLGTHNSGRASPVTGLSPLQMLVGTVAFNTLRIVDPADSSAFPIWVLGYLFQGFGMAISFIVSPEPFPRYSFLPAVAQFITVHFYRAIRYGFHRYVNYIRYLFLSRLILAHRGAAANSTFVSVGPPGNSNYVSQLLQDFIIHILGFTALAILQLASYGRKM